MKARISIPALAFALASAAFEPAMANLSLGRPAGGPAGGVARAETTDVRMVEQDVLVRIFADSIVTAASFSLRNEGVDVEAEVGVSFDRPDDVLEFRAFVDGRPVEVREERYARTLMNRSVEALWKSWRISFRAGESREIRVEYRERPAMEKTMYFSGRGYEALSPAARDTLQWATSVGIAEYALEPSRTWKGVLDRCRITFEVVGLTGAHVRDIRPANAEVEENRVVWKYARHEPAGGVGLRFYPNLPPEEIPPFLRGVADRHSDDALVAGDIGIVLGTNFGRRDLMREIFHLFLARWDGSIPQIMEYAPGGRCRFDQRPENRFYSVWKMASALFDSYGEAGELDRGMDIAPAVSKIAGAVVDSLETCELSERDSWTLEKAKEIRRLSSALIPSPR